MLNVASMRPVLQSLLLSNFPGEMHAIRSKSSRHFRQGPHSGQLKWTHRGEWQAQQVEMLGFSATAGEITSLPLGLRER